MKSICLLSAYFGKFPNYFELWLKSCEANSTIDFKIYSDIVYDKQLPKNVEIIPTTLSEVKNQLERLVGFEVKLDRPYKMCDIKPFYGALFQEDINNYDFWGYMDMDLILGDIRKYYTDALLDQYDRLNRWGHLGIFRNTEECNNRYKLDGSKYTYKEILTTDRDFGFDEFGLTEIYKKHQFPFYLLDDSIFVDVRAIHKRFLTQGTNYEYQTFYWENGRVFRDYLAEDNTIKTDEFLYIHFKKRGYLPYEFNEKEVNSFYITNHGFFEKIGSSNMEQIQKMNPYPGRLFEKKEKLSYKMRVFFRRALNHLGLTKR